MSAYYQTEFDRKNEISSVVETLGGPGVTQIFAHAITSIENRAYLAAMSPGSKRYSERALLIARKNDVVCVADDVDGDYLEFLRDLGIGPDTGNIVVASESGCPDTHPSLPVSLMNDCRALQRILGLIGQSKKIALNPFIASQKEFELAAALGKALGRRVRVSGGNSEIVDFANRKHNIRAKAIELGVPVAGGEAVELRLRKSGRPADLCLLKEAILGCARQSGRAIVRGSNSVSGSAITVVEDDPDSVQSALRKIGGQSDNRFYLVETMFDVITSPNVLMHIEPGSGGISCVGVTDQKLDKDLAHEGNLYPSGAKTLAGMIASARRLSEWLQKEGYTGMAGFDFGEYISPETGGHKYFLAEVNARINGAAYPRFLTEYLNRIQEQNGRPYVEAFLSSKAETQARSFAELKESYGRSFFNPETGKGLVPYNTGRLEYGKFNFAVFGESGGEVTKMYEDFRALSDKAG